MTVYSSKPRPYNRWITTYSLYDIPTSFAASGLEAALARSIAAGSAIVLLTRFMKAAGSAEIAK